MKPPRILIIDDEVVICQLLVRILGERGYETDTTSDGTVAARLVKERFYNLVITDLKMPQVSGLDVLKELKRVNPYVEVIVMTGYATIESAVEAVKLGAFDFICKPFDIEEFVRTVGRCLEKQSAAVNAVELSELGALFEMSKVVTARTDRDALLHMILNSAIGLTRATSGYIALLTPDGKSVEVKITRGLNEAEIDLVRVRGESEPGGGSKGLISCTALLSPSAGMNGVMCIYDQTSDVPASEREQRLISVLAAQAVSALENYALYAQLQDKLAALQSTIKELHETQNQLIQTEKLAAVGQLAFGIAHEIRNPLGIILGGVDYVSSKLPSADGAVDESIGKIKQAIDRANKIILSLLKFSRTSKLELQSVPPHEVLEEVLGLVSNQACLGKVRLQRDLHAQGSSINADPTMLRQAFFNLCINALDAMPSGGELRVSARAHDGECRVEIADTGQGIPQSVVSRIFDPFFTTKETGKGTGLGLTITHLIIQRHGGRISVESEEGKGTRFNVVLPLADHALPAAAASPHERGNDV